MSVKKYEINGVIFWRVYLDLRCNGISRARAQKRVNGIASEREALVIEKRLLRELTEELAKKEGMGARWSDVIDRWMRQQELYPTKRYSRTTLLDYEAALRNYTAKWLYQTASELTRADGREVLIAARNAGRGAGFCRRLKYTINTVYNWASKKGSFPG